MTIDPLTSFAAPHNEQPPSKISTRVAISAAHGSRDVKVRVDGVKVESWTVITHLVRGVSSKAKEFDPIQLHDIVTEGLDVKNTRSFLKTFRILDRALLLRAVGVSERTLQRATVANPKKLDSNASDRALRLATITEKAIDVLGSREAAERWLSEPALGLEQRRPIELLQSTEGAELVKTVLTRMDYGVYL